MIITLQEVRTIKTEIRGLQIHNKAIPVSKSPLKAFLTLIILFVF